MVSTLMEKKSNVVLMSLWRYLHVAGTTFFVLKYKGNSMKRKLIHPGQIYCVGLDVDTPR